MTNPGDHWRHQTSAAPHAPPHDVQTPGLPLNTTSFNPSSDASYAGPVGGPSGSAGLAMALVVFLFAAPIFGTLYPLAAGAGLLAGFVVNGVLSVAAPQLGTEGRLPFALLAAVIAFWTMSRLDHRLAAATGYRLTRHVVRLVLIATFISMTSLNKFSSGSWPRSAAQLRVLLGDPRFLPLAAVVAIVAHLLLTRAPGLRRQWHIGLEIFRLRPTV